MELNWTTFSLEVVNFLVLLWLLKRFLYRPVMGVIEARQALINDQLKRAEEREREATQLENRYQNRLEEWQAEKQQAHETLAGELAQKREQALQQLERDLDEARQKHQAVERSEQRDLLVKTQQRAYLQATQFASKLLSRLASAELENSMLNLVVEELKKLPRMQREQLEQACQNLDTDIVITTAYDLSSAQQQNLRSALAPCLPPHQQRLRFSQHDELIAGVRITIGSWRVEASLADELRYFSQHIHQNGFTNSETIQNHAETA